MSAPQKFRTALNGFNREDVAGYLEYMNTKHNTQVTQLTSEIDFLRTKLENTEPACDQAEIVAALEQERDALQSEVAFLRARCAELEAAQNAAVIVPSVPADELEIYRRAERTERMARERADMIYRQTNGILNEATVRVNGMADQVIPIADQLLMQVAQLQNAVNITKQSLQDAVVIMNTLRPDNN